MPDTQDEKSTQEKDQAPIEQTFDLGEIAPHWASTSEPAKLTTDAENALTQLCRSCAHRDLAARRWEVEESWAPLEIETNIPTPSGWKEMGALSQGDYVFGDDGRICSVTDAHPFSDEESYRLEFSDGTSIVAGATHLWKTSAWPNNHQKCNSGQKVSATRTTKEIFETQSRWHSFDILPGLDMFEAHLPVDPYLLGCWLGDGDSKLGSIYGAEDDLQNICSNIRAVGWNARITRRLSNESGKCSCALVEDLSKALWALGMKGNKHIPQQYLRASKSQRISLLQGLLDTDGWQGSRKQIGWGQAEERLALVKGFSELLRSLGVKHRMGRYTREDSKLNAQPFYQTAFHCTFQAFRLTRKLAKQTIADTDDRSQKLYIKSVVPVGVQTVRCITVDSRNHMFLAGESMIPTHNSRSFARGYQYLLPRRGGGWVALGFSGGGYWGNRNKKFWGNETNIYATYQEVIQAALTRDIPGVKFQPRNPRSDADITAKDAAQRYSDVFDAQNDQFAIQSQLANYMCTDGRVLLITDHVIDAQRFGRSPLIEDNPPIVPETEEQFNNPLIFVVRHGETEKNAEDKLRGTSEDPLNELGRRQAEKVSAFLRNKGITRIVCSPIQRSFETAEYISESLKIPLGVDEQLMAFDLGDLTGQDAESNMEEIKEIFAAEKEAPGGESVDEFDQRVAGAVMGYLQSPGLPMVIVCHDSVMSSIAKFFNPELPYGVTSVPPGGVSVIEIKEDNMFGMRPAYPSSIATAPEGVKRGVPRGQETVEVCGKLEHKISINTNLLVESPFVAVSKEYDITLVKAMFPDKAEKIKPGGSGSAEIELDRIARINTALALEASYITGDSLIRDVTLHRVWIRPCMFMEEEAGIDKEVRTELFKAFPEGVKVYMAGETFLCAVPECMDDHLTLVQALPGTGQNRKSLLGSLMAIQRRLNTWMDLLDAFFTRTIPQRYIDSKVFDVDAIATQTSGPGPYIPFLLSNVPQGRSPKDCIWVEETPTHQYFMPQFIMYFIEQLPQLIAHALPSLFGSPSNEDAAPPSGFAMALQTSQALAAQGTPWHAIKMATCNYKRQAVQLAARCRNSDIHECDRNGEAVDIELDDLKGNVMCFPEDDSNIPVSFAQQKAEWQKIFSQISNPIVMKLMGETRNIRAFLDAYGLADFKSSQADAYEKQMGEFDVLLQSGPTPNPQVAQLESVFQNLTAQAGSRIMNGIPLQPEEEQALTQLPQAIKSLPQFISTVPVKDTDDHASEAEACLNLINEPQGRKLANGSAKDKAAFANLLTHYQEHKAKIPPPPDAVKPASVSMNLKDMPPDAAAKELQRRFDIPVSGADVVNTREFSATIAKSAHVEGPQVPPPVPQAQPQV